MKKTVPTLFVFLLLAAALLLNGCASITPGRLPEPGRGSTDTQTMPMLKAIDDPLEPYNRGMSSFNTGFFRFFIYPFNRGYNFVVPAPVRKRIHNVGYNLSYPVRLVNTLLQGKFGGSLDETNRFLLNTTVGMAGIFDPATRLGIENHREDFGQTLGFYTGRQGAYLVLPFLGPSSSRDTLGKLLDMPFDLSSWLVGARAFFSNNDVSFKNDHFALLLKTETDPYSLVRNLWALDREKDVHDYKISSSKSDPEPSLQAVFFTPGDPDFVSRGTTRHVTIPATGKKFPYTYWMQKKKAPLVLVLPGLGAHRLSDKAVATAEMVYNHGYSAVIVSDTMNWEFMERAASVPVPGYTPQDCKDLVNALLLIRDDMIKRYAGRASSTALVGMSLGALKTLYIAAMDTKGQTGELHFDRYLAINPPVNMLYGITRLDGFFNAPLKWKPQEQQDRIQATLMKALTLGQGELSPGAEVPLSRIESDFLIGLLFRYTLRDIIYTSQRRDDFGVLACDVDGFSRQDCYNVIQGYSFSDYVDTFALPYYLQRSENAETRESLLEKSSLAYVEEQLRANERIKVHINENDFLLRPNDIEWLESVFGERLVRFKEGGHLGNLHLPRVQAEIMKSLSN